MHERFRVIETTTLDDGRKRYRVVDLVEGGSASKHGVFNVRTDAEAVCSTLNDGGSCSLSLVKNTSRQNGR